MRSETDDLSLRTADFDRARGAKTPIDQLHITPHLPARRSDIAQTIFAEITRCPGVTSGAVV
jgi:hypothetical protein